MENELVKNIRRLRNASFFKPLSDEMLVELAEQVETVELPKDYLLFSKGDPGDSLYIILQGWVKIVTEGSNGEELVLNHCGPGEAIGDVGLIDGEPRTAGVVTLSPMKAIYLKREVFQDILERQPLLALGVMRGMSSKIRFLTTYIEKAIDWSQCVARGDYGFMEQLDSEHSTIVTMSRQDEERVGEFLSAFYRMVQGVKEREDELKQQVQALSIKIDEVRRQQEVEQLTDSDFFKRLKSTTDRLRRSRGEN